MRAGERHSFLDGGRNIRGVRKRHGDRTRYRGRIGLERNLDAYRCRQIRLQAGTTSIVVELDFAGCQCGRRIVEEHLPRQIADRDRIACPQVGGRQNHPAHAADHPGTPRIGHCGAADCRSRDAGRFAGRGRAAEIVDGDLRDAYRAERRHHRKREKCNTQALSQRTAARLLYPPCRTSNGTGTPCGRTPVCDSDIPVGASTRRLYASRTDFVNLKWSAFAA